MAYDNSTSLGRKMVDGLKEFSDALLSHALKKGSMPEKTIFEDLDCYLMRIGWAHALAADVFEAYYKYHTGYCSVEDAARLAARQISDINDEDHDYEGEMRDDIVTWQRGVWGRDG